MTLRFSVGQRHSGQWFFALREDGQTVATSRDYPSQDALRKAIATLKDGVARAEVDESAARDAALAEPERAPDEVAGQAAQAAADQASEF